MSHQYRSAPPPCPLCGNTMEDRAAADAVVDVCTECHAVWIDWFDGDVAVVASDVQVVKTIPKHISDKHPCPRCKSELTAEPLYQKGPEVFRCAECSGVLVPSVAIDEVVALGASDKRGESTESGTFARIVAKLRKVFDATSQ